jgi:hypothetical protein
VDAYTMSRGFIYIAREAGHPYAEHQKILVG